MGEVDREARRVRRRGRLAVPRRAICGNRQSEARWTPGGVLAARMRPYSAPHGVREGVQRSPALRVVPLLARRAPYGWRLAGASRLRMDSGRLAQWLQIRFPPPRPSRVASSLAGTVGEGRVNRSPTPSCCYGGPTVEAFGPRLSKCHLRLLMLPDARRGGLGVAPPGLISPPPPSNEQGPLWGHPIATVNVKIVNVCLRMSPRRAGGLRLCEANRLSGGRWLQGTWEGVGV